LQREVAVVSIADERVAAPGVAVRARAQGLLRLAPLFVLPGFAIVVFALIAWANIVHGISIEALTRDMATLARLPPFVSIASSLGAFVMCATAACCLFAFFVARAGRGGEAPWHLLAVGLFSLYLMTDDFYEFHDRVFPDTLGVPQPLIYALIAGAAGAITLRWWRRFLAFRPWLLGAALVFLSTSVALDLFDKPLFERLGEWQFFWEDGAKFLGICLWATYFIALSQQAVLRPRRAGFGSRRAPLRAAGA
jgi:hypothetical protein